jgi:hypothetical protein
MQVTTLWSSDILELGQSDEPSPRTFDATDMFSVIALRKNHAKVFLTHGSTKKSTKAQKKALLWPLFAYILLSYSRVGGLVKVFSLKTFTYPPDVWEDTL